MSKYLSRPLWFATRNFVHIQMCPYRHLHTPHLTGYVVTGDTRYVLAPLPNGGTRLTLRAQAVMRIDPIVYCEPIARSRSI
jgi:hypothetical protein